MARTKRRRTQTQSGALPLPLARFLDALALEPSGTRLGWIAVLGVLALYAGSLGHPLVYADFAQLAPAQLAAYARAWPEWGSRWLADASFGWTALIAGERWPWHRALNVALHALNVGLVYLTLRRFCAAGQPRPGTLAGGWIALLAAALFALHPVAVYAVAYLSQRAALLGGLFASVALWSCARAAQEGWRGAWVLGPAACAAALACGPAALGLPLAMALVAACLGTPQAHGRRTAWIGVGASALVACAYLWVYGAPPGAAGPAAGGVEALGAASARLLAYAGLWLVPVTPWMAIEITEPVPGALPAAAAIALVALLAIVVVAGGVRGRRWRPAALGLGCAFALYAFEWGWPGLARPFALAHSYAWMGFAPLVLAAAVGTLPARVAFTAGVVLLLAWVLLASTVLASFASHVALWDAAVRRAERVGASPADARIYLNRAAVHRRDGHLIAAIADYDRALELAPDQPRALRGRAQAYIDDRRYGAALRDLDRLLVLEPQRAATHADRGLVLMQAGRLAEAGAAFDRAIAHGVNEPRVYLNRGLARLQMNGLEAAPAVLEDIERALALDPDYALAYYNRGLVFEEAARAGIRLRDAVSPEIMRAIAAENMRRACAAGHAPACARRADEGDAAPTANGRDQPLRVTPESLRRQGLPPVQ